MQIPYCSRSELFLAKTPNCAGSIAFHRMAGRIDVRVFGPNATAAGHANTINQRLALVVMRLVELRVQVPGN